MGQTKSCSVVVGEEQSFVLSPSLHLQAHPSQPKMCRANGQRAPPQHPTKLPPPAGASLRNLLPNEHPTDTRGWGHAAMPPITFDTSTPTPIRIRSAPAPNGVRDSVGSAAPHGDPALPHCHPWCSLHCCHPVAEPHSCTQMHTAPKRHSMRWHCHPQRPALLNAEGNPALIKTPFIPNV